ncbi:hypothetical protein PX699_27310 [Sphingobium sp. H39-3-25]|uniref:hypothetical protein n=1 Tax=Sphingobium arseniciresistens TaxID=3030834 RepID=UPI0023B9FC19|nr:hypothetical protein [Sphingobium arseniciresistens]
MSWTDMSLRRSPQHGCKRFTGRAGRSHDLVRTRELLEEPSHIVEGIGRERGMEVLNKLEIATPTGEGKISGPDQQMRVVVGEQRRNLRVEDPMVRAGNRLDLIVPTDTARALLAQAGAHAFGIRQDQGIAAAAPQQRVEQDGLEEGKGQSIGCERNALPRRGRNEFKRIHKCPQQLESNRRLVQQKVENGIRVSDSARPILVRWRELAVEQVLRSAFLLAGGDQAGQEDRHDPESEHAKENSARDFQYVPHDLKLPSSIGHDALWGQIAVQHDAIERSLP